MGERLIEYRGVAQNDIMLAVLKAGNFLRTLRLGPVSQKVLADWLAHDPINTLAQPLPGNQALADFLGRNQSDTLHTFCLFRDIFDHYALRDLATGSGKAGRHFKMAAALQSFAALDEDHRPLLPGLPDEIFTHVAIKALRHLNPEDIDTENNPHSRFNTGLQYIAEKYADEARAGVIARIKNITAALANLAKAEKADAARDYLLSFGSEYQDAPRKAPNSNDDDDDGYANRSREQKSGKDAAAEENKRRALGAQLRRHVASCLTYATGVSDLRDELPQSPMKRYGLCIPDYTHFEESEDGPMRTGTVYGNPLRLSQAAINVATQFNLRHPDDITGLKFGSVNNLFDGMVFHATWRGAQAIADALPLNPVLDERGFMVKPTTHSAIPAYRPAPPSR